VTIIRKAKATDVPAIYALLIDFGQRGIMLPRSLSELYDVIRDFHVACDDDAPEALLGVCALHVTWADLGEIRSLAVQPDFQGTNLGAQLLGHCLGEGRELGLTRVFALTYIPEYFKKFNFKEIDRSLLPHKIWADCIKCVKFPECGEIALEKRL
jgi:amino-acid N-acetyltransferase